MPHRARRCATCGQLYHGAPWSRLCDGCRAEREEDGRFQPTGQLHGRAGGRGHGEPDRDRVCMWCRHCLEECCDMGICDVKLKSEPQDFDSWLGVVDYIEDARVDMQADSCAYWKEY
ncbi:MAG: hypothetical protein ACLTSX_00990 [Collinsella sp.]